MFKRVPDERNRNARDKQHHDDYKQVNGTAADFATRQQCVGCGCSYTASTAARDEEEV